MKRDNENEDAVLQKLKSLSFFVAVYKLVFAGPPHISWAAASLDTLCYVNADFVPTLLYNVSEMRSVREIKTSMAHDAVQRAISNSTLDIHVEQL